MWWLAVLVGLAGSAQVWALEPVSTQARDLAQVPPEDEGLDLMNEVTVTGSLLARTRADTTTPVYIIDRNQIEQKGSRTLGDALRNTPGVTTNIFGAGADVHNGYFIRGVPTTSTAILIDGRPITNLNQEHYDPGEIPVDNVERIEVMPSGGTTLYGSTALGGVVNVITRKVQRPLEGNLGLELGSYGYTKYSASYAGKNGPFTFGLRTENFNTINNFFYQVQRPVGTLTGIRPGGDVNARSYNLDLGYELDRRNTLTFNSYLRNSVKGISPTSIIDPRTGIIDPLDGRSYTADEIGLNDDHKSRLYTDTYGMALTWDSQLGQADDSKLQMRVSLDRALNREVDVVGDDFRTEIYLLGTRISHAWKLNPTWQISYGLDYLKEMGRSEVTNLNELDYSTSLERPALFLLNEFKLAPNLAFNLGGRCTLTDRYGTFLDPSAGLRWQISPNVALRTSYNTGIKTPNFHDLFGKTVHKGNPNLLPERGYFWDGGIDWQPQPGMDLQLTTFISDIRNLSALNLVDPRQADFAYYASLGYVNGDRVRTNYPSVAISGFELAFNWKLARSWEFFLTNTYTDARVVTSGRPEIDQTQLALVPLLMGRVGFAYEENGWRAALFANITGGRSVDTYHVGPGDVLLPSGTYVSHVAKLPTGSNIAGYTTVDLSLRVPLTPQWTLTGYVDNLLNTYYERSYGGPAPGTNFRAGLNVNF